MVHNDDDDDDDDDDDVDDDHYIRKVYDNDILVNIRTSLQALWCYPLYLSSNGPKTWTSLWKDANPTYKSSGTMATKVTYFLKLLSTKSNKP